MGKKGKAERKGRYVKEDGTLISPARWPYTDASASSRFWFGLFSIRFVLLVPFRPRFVMFRLRCVSVSFLFRVVRAAFWNMHVNLLITGVVACGTSA